MKVVFILLDAFSNDYISKKETPFLFEKASNGIKIKRIIPSAGFCERTEIFFGLKPNESGFFTAIGFDVENGIYKKEKFLNLLGRFEYIFSNIFHKVFKKKKNRLDCLVHKIIDKIYFKFFGAKKKLKTYKIPHLFLKYFNLTEDEFELDNLDYIQGRESIFNIIKESKKRTYMGAFTSLRDISNGDDANRLRLAIKASKSNDFVPVYINCIDSFGHKFGPNSKELKKKTNELDKMLESTVNEILDHSPNTVFYFLGDHGMTEVQSQVDLKNEFFEISKKNNLKAGKDFVYFLDSTLMRIWFFNQKTKKIFEKELTTNPIFKDNGTILDKYLAKKFDIPFKDRRYGDMTWWANEGVLIFPDFFHNENIVKGMHGYQPTTKSTFGTCIVWGDKVECKKIDSLELSDIYFHLKEMIKLS